MVLKKIGFVMRIHHIETLLIVMKIAFPNLMIMLQDVKFHK